LVFRIYQINSRKIYYQKQFAQKYFFLNPEDRIIKQLNDYKEGKDEKIIIELTRKELSNMTGLRIETIIRTIKKWKKMANFKL
jgi:CRP-like cAMP-binding protein